MGPVQPVEQPFAKQIFDRDTSDPNASLTFGMTTTPTNDGTPEQFMAITCSTPDDAVFYLRFSKGNLQQAVENYFADDSSDDPPNVLPPPPRFGSPPLSGFLSPPPAHRKHPGDSDHEHDRDGARVANIDFAKPFSDKNNQGSSAKRIHTPTRPLPEVYTPSGAVAEPSKGPTYDADLALATSLQREYDTRASDYRLGWGPDHPSLTKPKGAVPGHWIRNPNFAGLGPNFNTSLGGLNGSLGAIPTEPFPQKAMKFQAPDEILSPLQWEEALQVGTKEERWILINIQDPAIPKCQVLNRDIWNDMKVVDLVREKFIFLQCRKEEYRARDYICYYFTVSHLMGAYPHIAIVDPRSGEQLKLWSGYVPKTKDFIGDLRDFLDLYSLNPRAKKPVGRAKGSETRPEGAVEAEAEADQPWYIQSVEQPQSFFDDLYGVSDTEEPPHRKANTPNSGPTLDPSRNTTSQSPEIHISHFDAISPSSSKTLALHPSPSSSHSRPTASTTAISSSHSRPAASNTIINFCRLSGQPIIKQEFSLSEPVRAMYEWLESREDGAKWGRRLKLSFEGRDLSEGFNARIADIPGLVGNNNGGEGVNNVLVSINAGVLGGEKN